MQNLTSQLLDPPPDASQIDPADCLLRPLPKVPSRVGNFQVVLSSQALEKIRAHGQTNLKAEVGGVLVGKLCRDDAGPYLLVQTVIEGKSMRHHAAQVTFTADTWTDIQRIMDQDYPDKKIVGWYHTHPGFGLFLSEMDLFIQNNFFNLPWQVALVHDPKADETAVFIWRNGVANKEDFLIATPKQAQNVPRDVNAPAFPPATLADLSSRQLELERRHRDLERMVADRITSLRRKNRWLIMACLVILILTLAWSIVATSLLWRAPDDTPPANPTTQNKYLTNTEHFANIS